jgi:hypothetical protein
MSARNGDKANGSPNRLRTATAGQDRLREASAGQGRLRDASAGPARQPRRTSSMKHSADREVCPKCGRPNARLIGRSETFPVLYLRCDDCNHTSVAPA